MMPILPDKKLPYIPVSKPRAVLQQIIDAHIAEPVPIHTRPRYSKTINGIKAATTTETKFADTHVIIKKAVK